MNKKRYVWRFWILPESEDYIFTVDGNSVEEARLNVLYELLEEEFEDERIQVDIYLKLLTSNPRCVYNVAQNKAWI